MLKLFPCQSVDTIRQNISGVKLKLKISVFGCLYFCCCVITKTKRGFAILLFNSGLALGYFFYYVWFFSGVGGLRPR